MVLVPFEYGARADAELFIPTAARWSDLLEGASRID